MEKEDFYVVALESGVSAIALPAWTNKLENIVKLEEELKTNITRVEVEGVPAAFQLDNVFTQEECNSFIKLD